jgi:ABC transporter substrate binding protein
MKRGSLPLLGRREFITLLGGGAAAWPLATRAQQPNRMQGIGVLMGYAESNVEGQAFVAAFREGLLKLGWAEGRKMRSDYRWAPSGDVETTRRFAKELVALQPNLILAHNTPATAAALEQTQTIPILFVIVADPVGSGFVTSFSWPASVDLGRLLVHERSAAQAPPEAPIDRLEFSQLTNATSMPCLNPGPDGPF